MLQNKYAEGLQLVWFCCKTIMLKVIGNSIDSKSYKTIQDINNCYYQAWQIKYFLFKFIAPHAPSYNHQV